MNFCGYIKFFKCRFQKEQDLQDKLEIYKILYQAYADEIKNLWQRSIFLGAFMTLAWGGYGALQLKVFDRNFTIDLKYSLMSIGLCWVIIILSLLWIAMAKGSKFVQEAHEKHIENLNFDKLNEVDIKTNQYKRLFCDLNTYELRLADELCDGLCLKAFRYSPSKINIALGLFSFIVAIVLSFMHILIALCYSNEPLLKHICYIVLIIFAIVVVFLMAFYYPITKHLKGGIK